MIFVDKKTLKRLREKYPVGCRVELESMDDPQAPPPNTKGTVKGVDDAGSILVNWDNGSTLNIIVSEDKFHIIGNKGV